MSAVGTGGQTAGVFKYLQRKFTPLVMSNWMPAKIIKEIVALLIKGGGGGQKTLATAGWQNVITLGEVIKKFSNLILARLIQTRR